MAMGTKSNEKIKEPFMRMSKRGEMVFWKSWLIHLLAVLIALVVCAVLINVCTGCSPIEVYKALFAGAFGTGRRMWNTVRDAMILLLVALGLTPAFKMKFWNVGGEGQILIGGIVTAAIMRYCGNSLSTPVLFFAMVVGSMSAGLIWGLLPAVFKAKWNTNETLFTLMMNYCAIQLAAYFCVVWEAVKGSGNIGTINQDTRAGWITTAFCPEVFGKFNYSINLLIVAVLTVVIFLYMKYSKNGYEIKVVGESENTAKYAGINVKKVIIRTMALSGGICGLAGFLLVGGSDHTVSISTAGGRGFTAIVVAWLSKFNPFIMILISFLLVALEKGSGQIASDFGLNESAAEVITGVILFFILGCEFFVNYQLKFRKSKKEA